MKFTESHEWIALSGKIGTVGITEYAQKELGEIVYVELPEVGKEVNSGQEIVVLESTKAAADVYSPVSGRILEVNMSLKEDSALVNSSPEDKGWLYKIELSKLEEYDSLMDGERYLSLLH
jgi:glycine cleavage system H protein